MLRAASLPRAQDTLNPPLPQELLKFLLNSTHNVLPTSDNLRRWGKTVVDLKCCLCGFPNPTLKHILNGCSMALKQGRYTWRHDSILQRLVEDLKSFVGCVNSGTVANISIENTVHSLTLSVPALFSAKCKRFFLENLLLAWFLCWRDISRDLFFREGFEVVFFHINMKKMKNEARNEIFRQMDAKGLSS